MFKSLKFLSCLVSVGLLCSVFVPSAVSEDKPKLAVFDFELYDTSLQGEMQGPDPEEQERLGMIAQMIRDALEKTGKYEIVEITPEAQAKASEASFMGCNGCETEIARELGADLSIAGHVHKVSNLILSITAEVRDVDAGKLVGAMGADIRGNTDESWRRGMAWLIEHRLLANQGDLAVQAAE